jgi:threonine dehydratase
VAALLDRPGAFEGPVVAVISGGNIDALLLLDVIRHGLVAAGRFIHLRVRITDRPGGLMRLLVDLASLQVNVINVTHDRSAERLGVREVDVVIEGATRGPDHRAEVTQKLLEIGHAVI